MVSLPFLFCVNGRNFVAATASGFQFSSALQGVFDPVILHQWGPSSSFWLAWLRSCTALMAMTLVDSTTKKGRRGNREGSVRSSRHSGETRDTDCASPAFSGVFSGTLGDFTREAPCMGWRVESSRAKPSLSFKLPTRSETEGGIEDSSLQQTARGTAIDKDVFVLPQAELTP